MNSTSAVQLHTLNGGPTTSLNLCWHAWHVIGAVLQLWCLRIFQKSGQKLGGNCVAKPLMNLQMARAKHFAVTA